MKISRTSKMSIYIKLAKLKIRYYLELIRSPLLLWFWLTLSFLLMPVPVPALVAVLKSPQLRLSCRCSELAGFRFPLCLTNDGCDVSRGRDPPRWLIPTTGARPSSEFRTSSSVAVAVTPPVALAELSGWYPPGGVSAVMETVTGRYFVFKKSV